MPFKSEVALTRVPVHVCHSKHKKLMQVMALHHSIVLVHSRPAWCFGKKCDRGSPQGL